MQGDSVVGLNDMYAVCVNMVSTCKGLLQATPRTRMPSDTYTCLPSHLYSDNPTRFSARITEIKYGRF